jgi:hypothetical protein
VTTHAGLGWRNSCKREFLNGGVTIAAIYPVVADVVFVTELNGLFAREKGLGVIRGPVELEQHPDCDADKKDRAKDGDFRYEVGASIEDLPHRFPNS